jgi:hypothetical protein
MGSRLRTTFKRIEDNLILKEPLAGMPPPTAEEIRVSVVLCPRKWREHY